MKSVSQISVDDEIAIGFSLIYDKKMVVAFDGYFDCESKTYNEAPCILIVKDWRSAVARTHGTTKYEPLQSLLGIIWMILRIEERDNTLQLIIQTCDERYLELKFEDAAAGYSFASID